MVSRMKKVLVYLLNITAICLCGFVLFCTDYIVVKLIELFLILGNAIVLGMNIGRDMDKPAFNLLHQTIKELCDENYNLARENEELKGVNN